MTISVIGLGLIGGSFAQDLRQAGLASRLIGVDISNEHALRARALGLVEEVLSLSEALRVSDVVVLATPVGAIATLLPDILNDIGPEQTVIDLGSTKGEIAQIVREHVNRARYVAAHPMAGTENAGPEAAMVGLFKGKTVLLCDLELSAPDACKIALEIFHAVGLKFEFMTSLQHDRHTAYVSHLAHVVAYALALTVQAEEKIGGTVPRWAGSGLTSTVRLAKSPAAMWTPILQQNREEILRAVDAFAEQLQFFRQCLVKEDYACLNQLIREANQIRDLL